ncbi:hypothetical protein F0562_020445 [Nyssa sinensis]|uniref:Protein kinase domain-containing protein n=1 Tax=Nyssa sinensis TaxID=561372 RepID=A0A5J5BU13_9ASTE|nr:hypothetical protein F0562_020445 [Nyssa sinensis]
MAQCCCRRSHSRLVLQVKLKQGLKIAMSISGEGNAYLQVLKQLNLPPEMKVPLSDEKGDIGRASSPWEILLVGYKIGMPEPLFKELAKPLLAKNDIKKLVDPSLVGAYDSRGDDLGEGGYGVVYRGHLINGTPRWYCPLVATACASAAFHVVYASAACALRQRSSEG